MPVPVSAITYGFVDTNKTYSNVLAVIVHHHRVKIYPISWTLITPDVYCGSHCTITSRCLEPLANGLRELRSVDPRWCLTSNKAKFYAVDFVVTNPK